jgi:hypothetical protein
MAKEITIQLTFANEEPQLISGREDELLSAKINHPSKLTYIAFDHFPSHFPKHHLGKSELTLINIKKTTFQQVIQRWKKWFDTQKEPTLPLNMHFRLLLLWKCRYGISVLPNLKISHLLGAVDRHENNSDVWWECPEFCSETLKDPDDEEEFKDWKGDQQQCKCYTDLDYPIKIVNQTGEEFVFIEDQKDILLMEAGVRQKAKLFDSEKPKSLSGNRCSPWCLGNHRSLMPFKDIAYNEAKLFYYNILHAGIYKRKTYYDDVSIHPKTLCLSLANLTATLKDTPLTSQELLSFLKDNFTKQDLMFNYDDHIFVSTRDRTKIKFRTVGRASLATSVENSRINTVTFAIKNCKLEWYQFAITFEGKNFKEMKICTVQTPGPEGVKMVQIQFFHPSSFAVEVDYNATDSDFVSLFTEKWKTFSKDAKLGQHIIYFDVEKEKYFPILPDPKTRKWYSHRYLFLQMGVRFLVELSPNDFWTIYSSSEASLKHIFKNFYSEELFEALGKKLKTKLLLKNLSCNDQQLKASEAHEIAEKTLKLCYIFKIGETEEEQTIFEPIWTTFETFYKRQKLQKYKAINTGSSPLVANAKNKKSKINQHFDINAILQQTPQYTLEKLGFHLEYVYTIC